VQENFTAEVVYHVLLATLVSGTSLLLICLPLDVIPNKTRILS
jgi:hypothetical protein